MSRSKNLFHPDTILTRHQCTCAERISGKRSCPDLICYLLSEIRSGNSVPSQWCRENGLYNCPLWTVLCGRHSCLYEHFPRCLGVTPDGPSHLFADPVRHRPAPRPSPCPPLAASCMGASDPRPRPPQASSLMPSPHPSAYSSHCLPPH